MIYFELSIYFIIIIIIIIIIITIDFILNHFYFLKKN